MKKILFIVFLMAGGSAVMAQSLDVTEAFIVANQFEKGKQGIDDFLSKPANANNPKAWYYKAYVYNALAKDPVKTLDENNATNKVAYDALKKYRQLDAKEEFTKQENNGTIYNVYFSFYDLAIKAYNAKNYEGSYNNFRDALDVHDYIYTNKLHGPKTLNFTVLDTDLVWNLAILANELKKGDEATTYYRKIVDLDLTDAKYLEAYEGVVIYYKKAKDQAMFNKYVEKGKQNFPKETFWEEIDIQNATDGLTGEVLFKKYDELMIKYPNSYSIIFYYANDLNRFVYSDESKNIDVTAYKVKVPELGKKALAINSTPEINMLLANHYYNNSFDLSDAAGKIKGTKPDDMKKKAALMTESRKSLDACLPYAEASVDLYSKMPKLRGTDKTNYRLAFDMLTEIYRVKGDPKKSAEYKVKKETIQ